jgi:hypothetical protein
MDNSGRSVTATTSTSLKEMLRNITDPEKWGDPAVLQQILRETPSARGMVYGNFAEAMFAEQLVHLGVPVTDQSRDDDHAKTKSDRTFKYSGRTYTVQVKSLQTESLRQLRDGTYGAKIQCDASDKRPITLPNGNTISTTCYQAGEFDVLAVPLQPFVGKWDFAFRTNASLPRSNFRGYSASDRRFLLATRVPITWPLGPEWTRDLFGLLGESPESIGRVTID